jgi:hypothetical protein
VSVKSEWRLNELLFGEDDPFDAVILSSGLSVDLTGSDEELFDGIKQTLELESRLFNRGITCHLKDAGQDCVTCGEYVADRSEEKRAPLCRLGRDQRMIEERYKAARAMPYLELADMADELSEIGWIEPEYVELLTAAGL